MPFPTWRMPAKNWLSFFICTAAMFALTGCYAPYQQGPYGRQPYGGQGYPPSNVPYGGTVIPSGPSLGQPTEIPNNSGDVPNYGSPGGSSSKGDDVFGDDKFDENRFNNNQQNDDRYRKGSSNKNGFDDREDTTRNDNFGNDKFNQDKPVPDYSDEEFIKPREGPSAADDDLESPFSEARKKKDTEFDAVPKTKADPEDALDEFNKEQPFDLDAPKKKSGGGMFDDNDMFENGSQLKSTIPLRPASSTRLLGKKEEAAIDRFIKDSASAQPNPYAYDKEKHSWLRGMVDYDKKSGAWHIIYDMTPDKKDPYGGSMTLVESPILAKLRDHDIILVEGKIDHSVEGDRLGKPRFRVVRVMGPLVPKKSQPKLKSPVAN